MTPEQMQEMLGPKELTPQQKEFKERTAAASVEIMQILKRYEINMVAQTNLGNILIEIPVSFKDLKVHVAEPEPVKPEATVEPTPTP